MCFTPVFLYVLLFVCVGVCEKAYSVPSCFTLTSSTEKPPSLPVTGLSFPKNLMILYNIANSWGCESSSAFLLRTLVPGFHICWQPCLGLRIPRRHLCPQVHSEAWPTPWSSPGSLIFGIRTIWRKCHGALLRRPFPTYVLPTPFSGPLSLSLVLYYFKLTFR